jgi:hypothetical protein
MFREANGFRLRTVVLGSLLLTGCSTPELKQVAGGLMAAAASNVPGVTVTPDPATAPGNNALAGLMSALVPKPGTPPLVTRPQASLMNLYAKRQVNGRELIDELVAMRKAMKEQRSAQAVARFMGSIDISVTQLTQGKSGGIDAKKLLTDTAISAAQSLLAQQVQSIGYKALDEYLQFLMDDPQLLQNERITLPSPQGLNPHQLQRGATMAALVVATKVTGRVLKKAKEDFSGLEAEYATLMQRREESAKVLYSLLSERSGKGLEKDFDGPDLAYLLDNVQRMTAQQFANDLGTQNLALRHLQRTNPQAFKDYEARADGITGRTRGVIRTSSGVLAFGALLANFGQSMLAVAKDKNASEILGLMPMAIDFLTEAPPIVQHAFNAGSKGVEVALNSTQRFRVVEPDGTFKEYGSAAEVFKLLEQRGEPASLFNESLFRNGSQGLLYRLYGCDAQEAGRLLDTAVPAAERGKFASTYLANEDARFSFANTFEAPRPGVTRERELGDELLRRDHRRTSDDTTRSFSAVQTATSAGYANWGNEQLMRLIFSNREGTAAHATLQLGDLRVRPVPNMQSLYIYESQIDGCRTSVGAPRVAPGSPKPGPSKPAPKKSPPPKPAAKPA